jgi:hypothetical protein
MERGGVAWGDATLPGLECPKPPCTGVAPAYHIVPLRGTPD